jgi:hypothetical protein
LLYILVINNKIERTKAVPFFGTHHDSCQTELLFGLSTEPIKRISFSGRFNYVCLRQEVRRDDATIALSLYLRLAFLGYPFTVARAPAASDTI